MFNFYNFYKEPLYRNSIAIMLNTASGTFFGLLFWIVAARTMSSTDIGLASTITSVSSLIITLSVLGMNNGLIRFLPKSGNKSNLYSTTLNITLFISIIVALVFLIGLNIFSPSLAFLKEGWFPLIFIIYVALTSINGIQNTAFIALRKGDISLIQNLILGIRIPILFVLSALGVIGIFFALEIAFLLSFIFGMYIIYRYGVKYSFIINRESLKETLGFSLGNYTANLFQIAPTTIIPLLILNTIGAQNQAYFFVAYSIAGLLFQIPSAISTSLFVEGSHDLPLKENIIKSMKFVLILLLPSILILYFFGDKILLLFSKEFSEQSFELLKLLAISGIFSAITSIYITIKRIQKDIKAINYINFIISFLLISLGYVLLLKFGLLGIGYAWLILNIIICICIIWISYRYDRFIKLDMKSIFH